MKEADLERLSGENDYLKRRCGQLEAAAADLGGQATRLQDELERLVARRAATGGQDPSGGRP